MTTHRIIVSGFGGQGVMGIGQLFAYAGMIDGKHVSWLPSYGPEMRGGSANCAVIVSDEPIGAPNISVADEVIVMNGPSLDKFEGSVKKDGVLFINTSLISRESKRDDVKIVKFPANDLAAEYGNVKTMNMIVVGAFNEVAKVCSKEAIEKAVEKLYGKKRPEMLEVNFNAIKFGAEKVLK